MVQEHKGQGAVVYGCRSHTLKLNNNMVGYKWQLTILVRERPDFAHGLQN